MVAPATINTIDPNGERALTAAITVSTADPIWGMSYAFTAREIAAAAALFEAGVRSQPEYTAARIAVEYNALPDGWEGPTGGLVEGSRFAPEELERIVWFAEALVRAYGAETARDAARRGMRP